MKVSSKGQVTLPKEIRDALGIGTGAVLDVGRGAQGCVVIRKRVIPGFFDKFAGLKSKGAPFASGDEAREALRVAEDQTPYRASRKRA